MNEYYSQFGADKYLNENYFHDKPSGRFIDIGAHDGITGSNTMFFEKLGWDGICFEPMPQAFEKLCRNRMCLLSNKALADFNGYADFVNIEGYSEQLSGLLENYSDEHRQRVERELSEMKQSYTTIKVMCGLFNNEIPFCGAIDILSIDTEGSESKIIKSIDFNKFHFNFIIAEFNYDDKDLINFLNLKGYTPITKLGVDVIFKYNG